MKIVADRNIPYIADAVAGLGEVRLLPGNAICADTVKDADILLTRTRTRCDASLLEGSRCSFVGTATIGIDHIDIPYCLSRSISVANAPGCNAPAVAQYVLSAIVTSLSGRETAAGQIHAEQPLADDILAGKTLGIIGVGNVGSILNRWALGLGMNTLLNDPPQQEMGYLPRKYSSLEEIAEKSDFISIHTPYTVTEPHPTHHLIDSRLLAATRRRPLIINAARGGVADTVALKDALDNGVISGVAIDCWENEPDIDRELLSKAFVATPHIAGYSFEGKVRATRMVLESLARHLQKRFCMAITPEDLTAGLPKIKPIPEHIGIGDLTYDIGADHILLNLTSPDDSLTERFEELRNNYHLREEPH